MDLEPHNRFPSPIIAWIDWRIRDAAGLTYWVTIPKVILIISWIYNKKCMHKAFWGALPCFVNEPLNHCCLANNRDLA